jgi:hypothetical protein
MESLALLEAQLTPPERRLLDGLDTPCKIQSFLDELVYPAGEANRSVLEVLRQRQAHCLDGGLFAAAALARLGYPPIILDMQPQPGTDDDHVLALYKVEGCWGALAKSNYSGLRLREPIYRTTRELALSYFEDFFNLLGEKTLRAITRPIRLARFDRLRWMTESAGVDAIEAYLKTVRLTPLISTTQAARLSPVDKRSFQSGTLGLNPEGAFQPQTGAPGSREKRP